MSPATKSKSKDKSSMKAVKEQQQKASSKVLTAPANGGNNIPGGAYNPLSGTFHSLERASSAPSSPPQSNGRFRTIDEREEHSGSSNGTPEYDSLSNGSCSGESEDQKERTVASSKPPRGAIPGSDTDKRDKIRQKNEKKHQRQRERRAQELHERCTGYLMSRKLEALVQQLVTMGFPSEQATTALILNEGQVEESIAWLLERGEGEQVNATSPDSGSNLKIDISDELARIAGMEVEFRCSKQEVERAIVACEGDMEGASEVLKSQKLESPVSPSKTGVSGEPVVANGEHKVAMSSQNVIARTQGKVAIPATQQQRGDERDFNYSKAVVTGAVPLGSRNRNAPSPKLQPKVELSRQQVPTAVDKRWLGAAPNPSVSVSYSTVPPSPVGVPPQGKVETRNVVVGSELRTSLRAGALKEPVVVMQRPQTNAKQNLPLTSIGLGASPAVTSGWYPIAGVSSIETVKVSAPCGLGTSLHNVKSSTATSISSAAPQYNMSQHQAFIYSSMDTAAAGWGGSNSGGGGGGTWNALGSSPGMSSSSLAVPSSLGLFTGWGSSGSSGSSSPVDWSTGSSMMQCDYTSIDWSLDSTPMQLPSWKTDQERDRLYDAWATALEGSKLGRPGLNGSISVAGLKDGGGLVMKSTLPSAVGSHEWTTPFAGKDLFSLSRRFVTSPSL